MIIGTYEMVHRDWSAWANIISETHTGARSHFAAHAGASVRGFPTLESNFSLQPTLGHQFVDPSCRRSSSVCSPRWGLSLWISHAGDQVQFAAHAGASVCGSLRLEIRFSLQPMLGPREFDGSRWSLAQVAAHAGTSIVWGITLEPVIAHVSPC